MMFNLCKMIWPTASLAAGQCVGGDSRGESVNKYLSHPKLLEGRHTKMYADGSSEEARDVWRKKSDLASSRVFPRQDLTSHALHFSAAADAHAKDKVCTGAKVCNLATRSEKIKRMSRIRVPHARIKESLQAVNFSNSGICNVSAAR